MLEERRDGCFPSVLWASGSSQLSYTHTVLAERYSQCTCTSPVDEEDGRRRRPLRSSELSKYWGSDKILASPIHVLRR
jgi:hypothetical protein